MRNIFVLVLLLAGSIYINVAQWNKTNRLQASLQNAVLLEPLKSGDQVPAMSTQSGQAGAMEILPPQLARSRVLYWTSPRCKWSSLNERSFRRLYELKRDEFDFIALVSAADTLNDARSTWNPPYSILPPPAPDLQRQARFSETPSTVVVDRQRKVLRSWKGAYLGEIKSEIEAFFKVTLPTLNPGERAS